MTESGQLIQVAPLLLFIMPSTAIETLVTVSVTALPCALIADRLAINVVISNNSFREVYISKFNLSSGLVDPNTCSWFRFKLNLMEVTISP